MYATTKNTFFSTVVSAVSGILHRAIMFIGSFGITTPTLPVRVAEEITEEPSQDSEFNDFKNCQNYESVSDILTDIDRTIKELKYPTVHSKIGKESVGLFKKIGPMIYPPDLDIFTGDESLKIKILPSFIFISMGGGGEVKEGPEKGNITASMFYAQKINKKTIECAHIPGNVYEVGFLYPWQKELYWSNLLCSIVEGSIVIPKKVPVNSSVYIPGKEGGARIPKRQWEIQEAVVSYMNNTKKDANETIIAFEQLVRGFFLAWEWRENYWRVSARRDGKRVTFLIKQQDPKRIFADRNITIRTKTGQKKRIIHFVEEHDRWIDDDKKITVKEHLRGLREFSWSGADCAVIAPKFHRFDMDNFTAEASFFNDKAMPKKGYMGATKLAKLLVEVEDTQIPRDVLIMGKKTNEKV